jgi:hypothetical protein
MPPCTLSTQFVRFDKTKHTPGGVIIIHTDVTETYQTMMKSQNRLKMRKRMLKFRLLPCPLQTMRKQKVKQRKTLSKMKMTMTARNTTMILMTKPLKNSAY